MTPLLYSIGVIAVAAVAALIAIEFMRRRYESSSSVVEEQQRAAIEHERALADERLQQAMQHALTQMRRESATEQAETMNKVLRQASEINRRELGATVTNERAATAAELASKKDVIDTRLGQVHQEMRIELDKLSQMVAKLSETSAAKFGEVDSSLRSHAEITKTLSESAQALRQAMASSSARGQWGERMAEDVLRMAGFVEHVNYEKQTQLEGSTGRPDFTFPLPKGHELYMDVKFPMAAYLKYLDAGSDAERDTHRTNFLRDVRARVKELAQREYARESARESVDYVLMFLPNETLTGFIHENDPELIDVAMGQRVVLCSPLTLFAFLGVIRQAHENFMIEKASDDILGLMGKFGNEWSKYSDQLDKTQRKFETLANDFDKLTGPRRRALERPLAELDSIRRQRNLPIDGELFGELADDPTPENIRRIGA